jgi:hypothetical protein
MLVFLVGLIYYLRLSHKIIFYGKSMQSAQIGILYEFYCNLLGDCVDKIPEF